MTETPNQETPEAPEPEEPEAAPEPEPEAEPEEDTGNVSAMAGRVDPEAAEAPE